jgi:hypothetical protein
MLRSRSSFASAVALFALVFSGVSLADQILETYSASLTTYLPTGKTKVQNVRPRAEQRGVNLDGSLRSAPGIPAALAGNPFESVWAGTASLEGVRLDTGTYNPFEIDISLPAPGHRWLVGRTYNARQDDSGQFNSNGYQGKNWFQISQPELHLYDDADNAKDVIYLVYGADRYVEFQRKGPRRTTSRARTAPRALSPTPRAHRTSGPTPAPTGQRSSSSAGTRPRTRPTGSSGRSPTPTATRPMWATVLPRALRSRTGSTLGGRITTAYDSANRRYTYTYSTHDSVTRLDTVEAEYLTSGTWTSSPVTATAAQVDYVYYTNESNGDAGDLKTVTITTPTSQSGQDHVKTKYFRYWEGTYDAVTNPGIPHELMLVLDYEGARNFDWSEVGAGEPAFDAGYEAATTANLKPYSLVYLEYDSSNRVNSATFNGSCGCGGGGANGVTLFTYGTNGSYSDGAGYDTTWPRRTVVTRADSTYLTQYFDELGPAALAGCHEHESGLVADGDLGDGGRARQHGLRHGNRHSCERDSLHALDRIVHGVELGGAHPHLDAGV